MLKLPSEHQEQVAVVQWLRRRGLIFFAVPNGAKMGAREGSKMKKEGMQKGIPDLLILNPPIALEMKRREGGRLSPEQEEWGRVFESLGWSWVVGYGAKDAIQKIEAILKL
jgi:hypothetical protein